MGKQAFEGVSRSQVFYLDPDDLVIVGLDTTDGPEHPFFDERIRLPLDPLKVREVAAAGIRVPIRVHKDGERTIVEYGRQRVRWAREANTIGGHAKGSDGRVMVPVQSRQEAPEDRVAGMIVENEHRETDPPYLKAKKAARCLAMGMPEAKVAGLFATSVSVLRGWLKLLDLAPEVQADLAAGKITAAQTKGMQDLPHAEQAALNPVTRRTPPSTYPPKRAEHIATESAPATPAPKLSRQTGKPVAIRGPQAATIRKAADSLKASKDAAAESAYWALLWSVGDIDSAEFARQVSGTGL